MPTARMACPTRQLVLPREKDCNPARRIPRIPTDRNMTDRLRQIRNTFVALALLSGTAVAGETLLVIGDTGDCSAAPGRVAAAMKAQPDWRQALLVEVGDLAYPTATIERLRACHEPHFADFRRVAVPGNHDWRDPGAAGFFSLFPQLLPRRVDLGAPWRLLLLDSNLNDTDWQRQLDWLDQAVADSAGRCLIPVWHHPRWSSGRHGDNDFTAPLWSRLARVASFSLHGHDHHFEALPALDAAGRPDAAGLPSFVVGNGGARLYAAGDKARSQRAHFGRWGFLRIDLDGEHYRWQAIDVDGKRIDAGDGRCRQR